MSGSLRSEIDAAVGELARAVASQLRVVIADFEQRVGSTKSLAKNVERVVPQVFEEQFQAMFLVNEESARRQRALLAHLLSTVEIESTASGRVVNRASTEQLPSANDAADPEEVTSEQAAKLLHVSRTHVNTLADSGDLGTTRLTPGGHRRLSKAAVLQYKERSTARQARGLERMMEATQRLGLYEAEMAAIPKRRGK